MDVNYQLIAETAEDHIFIVDRKSKIVYINAFGAEMLGGSPEMIIGQEVDRLFPKDTAEFQKKTIKQVFRTGKPSASVRKLYFNDRDVWLSTRLFPIYEQGKVSRVLGISRDITELKKKEMSLETNQERLESRLRHASALNRMGGLLMSETNPKKLILLMAEGIGKALGADSAQIYEINLKRNSGELLAEWIGSRKDGLGASDKDFNSKEFQQAIMGVWKSRQPIISHFDQINPVLSASGSSDTLHKKYKIKTFLCYPFDFREMQFSILTLSQMEERHDWSEEELQLADSFTNQLTVAVMKAELLEKQKKDEKILKKYIAKLENMLEGTVNALAFTAEQKDPYTAGHQRRVVQLTNVISAEMDLSKEQANGIRIAAMVHDIGKIYIPAEILSKPCSLSDLEFGMVQTHSQYGFDILKGIEFPWPVANTVLQHHERLDGSGYPHGVKGDDICLEARILAVADVVEAMLSHRPYRAKLSMAKTLSELEKARGSQLDKAAVDACVKILKSKKFEFE